jgi:hypothetical protein
MEAVTCSQYCSGQAVRITYSECVSVALVTQHATRMRRIILPSVTCPTVPYLSTLSHKRHDFAFERLRADVCVAKTELTAEFPAAHKD